MLPAGSRTATSWVLYTTSCNTQSSAPKDGQNNCPKHAELTGIINKPLMLHLVGCLYYLYQWCTLKQISDNEIYLLIKYIKSVLWKVAKRLSYTEDARCLKVKEISSVRVPPIQRSLHLLSNTAVARRSYSKCLYRILEMPYRREKIRKPTRQTGRECQDTALGFIRLLFPQLAGVTTELWSL
jgi:hypothetical protein